MARDTVAQVRTDLTALAETVSSLPNSEEVQQALDSTFEHVNERLTTLENRVARQGAFLDQLQAERRESTTTPSAPSTQQATKPAAKQTTSGSNKPANVFHASAAAVKACHTGNTEVPTTDSGVKCTKCTKAHANA